MDWSILLVLCDEVGEKGKGKVLERKKKDRERGIRKEKEKGDLNKRERKKKQGVR